MDIARTKIKILNFTFSIINDENCKSAAGCYILAMFELLKENYIETKESLEIIFSEIKDINEITIDNKKYNIEKCISADLKFLANLMGINAALANKVNKNLLILFLGIL